MTKPEHMFQSATGADVSKVGALVNATYGHCVERLRILPRPMTRNYAQGIADQRVTVSAMRGSEEQREFRLGWSLFRRAHQAVAKRSHKATHSKKHATIERNGHSSRGGPDPIHPSEDGTPKTAVHVKKGGLLADAEWERVRVLLPKQKPGLGRPRRDNQQVPCGILWIMESGSSWQDLPEEEFGPPSTVRGRYRKWLKEGLWCRIVEALGRRNYLP